MTFHLLLVDDQLALLDSLTRRFERRDFRVSKASDLTEARRILNEEKVDVCVCDMELSETESGLDLIRYVKEEAKHKTPIIVLTGHEVDGELGLLAQKAGAFSVFSKPTDFALLLEGVRSALEIVVVELSS
jgi:DNA-binding NtrC family response regulator